MKESGGFSLLRIGKEEPDNFPKANAVVVAPATFNTMNK
jgi:hypothetical protein